MANDWTVLLGLKGGPAEHPGSPMPTASQSHLAGQNIVVDCGIGVTRSHLLASHTPSSDVGQIAAQAHVRHLVLNHPVPIDDPDFTLAHWQEETALHWSGRTTIGSDGLSIPIT